MCRLCAVRSIESVSFCPMCRNFLQKEDYMTIPRTNRFSDQFSKENNIYSSKIKAIDQYLNEIINDNNENKCIIFS